MRPITIEEAVEKLETSLSTGDVEGIEKWDLIIRSENDFRLRNRTREREMYEENLKARMRRAYYL